MTTRLNPVTQQLEGYIPELSAYAAMVIPAIINGGYTVKLNAVQAAQLQAIVEAINTLIIAESAPTQSLAALLNLLTTLQAESFQPQTQALNLIANGPASGDSLAESLTGILTKLEQLRLAVEGVNSGGAELVAGTQAIQHIPMANANQQYEATIPAGTVRYSIESRDDAIKGDPIGVIRVAFVTNKVAPTGGGNGVDSYLLIAPEQVDTVDQFFDVDTKIYFAGEVAGTTIVLRRWQRETA